MRRFHLIRAVLILVAMGSAITVYSQATDDFQSTLAGLAAHAEKESAGAVAGSHGWYFVASELRMMSVGQFWGPAAAKVSRSPKPDAADPLPAILDFNQQLKARGISLVVVPVPPKAEIYPEDLGVDYRAEGDPNPRLGEFYKLLRENGVDVIDLAPIFRAHKADAVGPVYCRTDTHWSDVGCQLAAQAIAADVQPKLGKGSRETFGTDTKEIAIDGDLAGMLPAATDKPGPETIAVRQTRVALIPDPNSPLLLLGDSHALVFHDFLAERAGLLDQLAVDLAFVPDRIAIRGSGATPVRIDLYRRSLKEPDYLAKKKVIVWCFTAREFTEAAQGWQKLPVAK